MHFHLGMFSYGLLVAFAATLLAEWADRRRNWPLLDVAWMGIRAGATLMVISLAIHLERVLP